ncbi:hypothetical protein HMPREF9120_01761 [Neisseria sp. oral taxon 020 str. F0370]|nr:hypothetical protein HMPREF9120_01761 [Neisseria sp. oral taxon 020 str. F0370]
MCDFQNGVVGEVLAVVEVADLYGDEGAETDGGGRGNGGTVHGGFP